MRDPVWVQRGLDALKATLDVDPVLKQQMIDYLLAEGFWDRRRLSDVAARTKFNACLNPGKPDFFKLSEIWALMKRFRRYELLFAMCEDMGFETPVQIPLHQRRADLIQRMQQLRLDRDAELAAVERQLAQLDLEEGEAAVEPPSAVVRVHPAVREPGPAFDLQDQAERVLSPGAF